MRWIDVICISVKKMPTAPGTFQQELLSDSRGVIRYEVSALGDIIVSVETDAGNIFALGTTQISSIANIGERESVKGDGHGLCENAKNYGFNRIEK